MNFLENLLTLIGGIAGLLIVFACLSAFFMVIGDVFRDPELNGWGRSGWVILLVFLPLLGVLLYLIVRGKGMDERTPRSAQSHHLYNPGNRYDQRFTI